MIRPLGETNQRLRAEPESVERQDRYSPPKSVETQTEIPELPHAFLCPITQEAMQDPVITGDGHTYERSAIQHWLQEHDKSPKTGLRLESKNLAPNHALRSQIDTWMEDHYKGWHNYREVNKLEEIAIVHPTRQVSTAPRQAPIVPDPNRVETVKFATNVIAGATGVVGMLVSSIHVALTMENVSSAAGRSFVQNMIAPEMRGFALAEAVIFGLAAFFFVVGHIIAYRGRRV